MVSVQELPSPTPPLGAVHSNGHVPLDKIKNHSVSVFAVAVDICGDRKFLKFKRALRLDERTAYICFVRFINFVAKNHAFTGKINLTDADVISDFCWFDGPENNFIIALQTAGFLLEDGTIKDWFEWQSLAKYINAQRENGKKGGLANAQAHHKPNEAKASSGYKPNEAKPPKEPSGHKPNRKKSTLASSQSKPINTSASAKEISNSNSLEGKLEPPTDQPQNLTSAQKPCNTHVDSVIQILNLIGHRTGIHEYQKIGGKSWEHDLRQYGMKLGFQCIHNRAMKFQSFMLDQFEHKKLDPRATHNARLRFFNNWLDKTFDKEKTTGDYDEIIPTHATADSPTGGY